MARRILLLVLLLVVAILAVAWFTRERIARTVLDDFFASRGIEAHYSVEEIGPSRQVVTDIVLGDPDRPDLTADRIEVQISPRFGIPTIESVRLVSPRIYGTWLDGVLSFGALDPLIFTEGDGQPFELPDLRLAVEDGRALIETGYGPVGLALAGGGHLRGGFAAELAASAPNLATGGCSVTGATAYGEVTIDAERPGFAGPLRFGRLSCPDGDLALAGGDVQVALEIDRAFTGIEGQGRLQLGELGQGANRLAGMSGEAQATWRDDALTARYDLVGTDLATAQVAAAAIGAEGLLRARGGFDRIELTGTLTGEALRPAADIEATLASAADAASGTLAGPLLQKFLRRLHDESRASELTADYTLRKVGERLSLVIPQAAWRGGGGSTLLSVSRAQLAAQTGGGGGGLAGFSGNVATGGEGLPRISGSIERTATGATRLDLRMAEYAAGDARLAVPGLALTLAADGSATLAGDILASGALPGGAARNLAVPMEGSWSRAAGFALWPGCTRLSFDSLTVSSLTFARQRLDLCAPPGSSIVRYGEGGLQIAAGASALRLRGSLGTTPISIASGPVGIAWPGVLAARDLDVALGPAANATRFALTDLTAEFSRNAGGISGDFNGADVFLDAVPLDVREASGLWTFAEGVLRIGEGAFTLEDRQGVTDRYGSTELARFRPLVTRDASLRLEDNLIVAEAVLRRPDAEPAVLEVALRHDLASGTGAADLVVPGLDFGQEMQPVDLTRLALGVVANVEGRVTGAGRIDWDARSLTSTGSFSSDALDFAAAFGPVKGASGTIVFTDLIGLTTAPHQRLAVASVNPGIEVFDGEIALQLREGAFIELEQAAWPFLGGTLAIRPLTVSIGVEEERSYILDIVGLRAASFVERMELGNLSASGTFDGTVPLIFDPDGNGRVEGGTLRSRPPGGNLAYVGKLTYQDLPMMAGFAFDALRSLDYREIRIGIDGPLTGELVTRVAIEGVSQGEGTSNNFITARLARLPIRMIVNVRAPFYQLISSIRSMYDPSAVRDPRDLGLLGANGQVLIRRTDQGEVDERDAAREAAETDSQPEADIQPDESEDLP